MKIAITICLGVFVIGCTLNEKSFVQEEQNYFVEKQLSFFDPYEVTYANHKHQGYTYETWLRKPKNLIMLHETFKKIGYHNLVSNYELTSDPCLLWGYVKRPLNEIMDSLIITYPLETIQSKYYREFWLRRIKEGNDEVVHQILTEVSDILLRKKSLVIDENLVNDTLYNLVKIEKVLFEPTKGLLLDNFNYLKRIGLHGSAYNLLFERNYEKEFDWNRDSLVAGLKLENEKCCPNNWVIDLTK